MTTRFNHVGYTMVMTDVKRLGIFKGVKVRYVRTVPIVYHSKRYKKTCTVKKDYVSDGATGPAMDIASEAWWVHDVLCEHGTWDDGTPCSNWQASNVLHDILASEGRRYRAAGWFVATALGRPAWNWLASLFK